MEATSPPDMRHMKKSADKLMDLVMYLFMFYYSYTVHYFYNSRKKKLKMASGGELYVELC